MEEPSVERQRAGQASRKPETAEAVYALWGGKTWVKTKGIVPTVYGLWDGKQWVKYGDFTPAQDPYRGGFACGAMTQEYLTSEKFTRYWLGRDDRVMLQWLQAPPDGMTLEFRVIRPDETPGELLQGTIAVTKRGQRQ